MRLLLDTHVFIWWDSDPARLSPKALALCTDPANDLVLSVASLWEMQIKRQLGKLILRTPLAEIVTQQQTANGLTVMAVISQHIFALDSLPAVHKDPFDRLLVAQAISEDMLLLSADPVFASYPARIAW